MKIVVHRFVIGDVDDPDLYAAQPLWEWEKSEAGKWVMEHAIGQPQLGKALDYRTYGYQYHIVADLKDKDVTFYNLKWGNK